jgi:hypothetical protein
MEGGEPRQFDWSLLVPHVVHPLQVAVIEALLWIGQPLSSADLEKVFGLKFNVSLLAYHVRKLAETGVLVPIRSRQRRGATETFYFFAGER